MTLRAALIGCGRIGSQMADDPLLRGDVFTHAEAYVRAEGYDLVAVCDTDQALARQCAARWNVPAWHTDPATLVAAERPDVISVCTPDHTHAAVMRTLVDADGGLRAILCEKPLATDLDDAREVVRHAETRGVVIATAYMRRYARNLRVLGRMLNDGVLGRVTAVSGWYTKGTLHNGSHWFDLLRMLVGEVAWVTAIDALHEDDTDPTLDVFIGLRSGALATLRALSHHRYAIFEMEIATDEARVRITDSGHDIVVERAGPSPRYTGYRELRRSSQDLGDRRNLMLHAVDDLSAALKERRPPLCSAADGIAALEIGTAAIMAARTGRRIALPLG